MIIESGIKTRKTTTKANTNSSTKQIFLLIKLQTTIEMVIINFSFANQLYAKIPKKKKKEEMKKFQHSKNVNSTWENDFYLKYLEIIKT